MMLTILFACYFLFVILRDGQDVAYKVWALWHDYVYKPYQWRRGWLVQYARNVTPPFRRVRPAKS